MRRIWAFVLAALLLAVLVPGLASAADKKEYSIDVNVTSQIVTIFAKDDEGEFTKIARQMVCSTGLGESPTPLGDFKATSRREWVFMEDSKVYCRFVTRIYRDYFFHSLLYEEQDLATLKKSSFDNLGKKASHGCIRLLDEDAEWIYTHIPYDTPVHIFEGEDQPDLRRKLKPGRDRMPTPAPDDEKNTQPAATTPPKAAKSTAPKATPKTTALKEEVSSKPSPTKKPSSAATPKATVKKPAPTARKTATKRPATPKPTPKPTLKPTPRPTASLTSNRTTR